MSLIQLSSTPTELFSTKSHTSRAALGRVCLKLVVVMGVTWCADVISWAVGGPNYLWYATDIINTLQGVLIFIVVGCQPQVITYSNIVILQYLDTSFKKNIT